MGEPATEGPGRMGQMAFSHEELMARLAEAQAAIEALRAGEAGLADANRRLEQEIAERHRVEQERERLLRELAEKNREIESLLYTTSHDLRSPMISIQGFTDQMRRTLERTRSILAGADLAPGLRDELAPLVEQRLPEAMEFVRLAVAKMDRLLAGLLQLSRLGRRELQIEPLDVNAIVARVVQCMDFRIEEAGASVQVDLLPACRGDPVLIDQAFNHLVDNAVKYLDPGRPGRIHVRGRVEDGQALYAVEDNGLGIPADQRQAVFEVFRRLDPNGPVAGEGLGLAIVRRIVERHHGGVWLESHPGRGSTFYMSLPAA